MPLDIWRVGLPVKNCSVTFEAIGPFTPLLQSVPLVPDEKAR